MAIEFYCGSGSPYAWRVWLALEHKRLPYTLRMVSFSSGDLKTPEYTALNPRRKVPVLVDDGFAVYESAAIVEYLEEAYPRSGSALFPSELKSRTLARRTIREADEYLAHAMEAIVDTVLFTPQDQWNNEVIVQARDRFVNELPHFARELRGDFFAGEVGAVDFTVYPLIALSLRMEDKKKPDLAIRAALGPVLSNWMKRIENLPFYDKTYPPHWKA
jgi:glutathione S-transferase